MKSYVFPGDIEESIREIAANPIPYMRTADFSVVVRDIESMLLSLIHCPQGRVIPYTASGTGAMDAVVTNYVSMHNKALILAGGAFGLRWKGLCDFYNYPNALFEVPFGRDADYERLEAVVAKEKPDIFLCQHHETSSGQLFDLKKISDICTHHGVSLVVDAISSFLSDPLDMDDLKIDICIVSSQKGLNISPGIALVFLSQRLKGISFPDKSYYFDFNENLKNLERGQTPYSPATTLFMQLHSRLQRNMELGVAHIIKTVSTRAIYFRRLCLENGWELPVETPSNCITGFFVHKNGDILFSELMKRGIFIMPGGVPNYFRVSHTGVQTCQDLDKLAAAIKEIEDASI